MPHGIHSAFVEENGSGRMELEMQAVAEELRRRQVPVTLFTEKRLRRRQLTLTKHTLVVGYVSTVRGALQQLAVALPSPNDYPPALAAFFHRRIWKSTVGELVEAVYAGQLPVFAKPDDQRKRFTGHVFATVDDLAWLEGAGRRTPISCSEVVPWQSEYRVFVIHGNVVGIRHYAGDPRLGLDEALVQQLVAQLTASIDATAGYALDLGLLPDGRTALVEWNDGFGLGAYGLDPACYTDLLSARWCELTRKLS